ncbi:MAG: radical SAM protein [Phycisphaerae bacterium]|nr:radical SAM protein [Phycisphaerae bacterium]
MKVALIVPTGGHDGHKSFYDYAFYSTFLLSKKYISCRLAIPTLAALTPPEHEIRVFDENVEEIDYSWRADLVGISVMTMFAPRAYEICKRYRDKGVKTVLGGIHPSMLPDEALEHCDSVVVGEAENVWSAVLNDAQTGRLKRIYQASQPTDLTCSPVPVRTHLARHRYLSDIVQTTKGCPFRCEFCCVHAFDGQRIRNKTVEQVVREIQEIQSLGAKYKKKKSIFFADDNIIANKEFATELFRALKPLNLNWMCQASMNVSQEEELLTLMRESGCGAIFIGFESLSAGNLDQMHKVVNRRYDYAEVIRRIQAHGMLIQASFILGYDGDCASVFDELIDFIKESHLLAPVINILTPFPRTELFGRLESQGRILHQDWSRYDTKHVVFVPAHMAPDELLEGYRKVNQEVYSFSSILERLNYYWDTDFWKEHNMVDPVRFKYRLLFAIRLCTLLASRNVERSRFIARILPKVFDRRVRVSSLLALMAYNDSAYSQ